MDSVQDEKVFSCEQCQKDFQGTKKYANHKRSHASITCKMCGLGSSTLLLENHFPISSTAECRWNWSVVANGMCFSEGSVPLAAFAKQTELGEKTCRSQWE